MSKNNNNNKKEVTIENIIFRAGFTVATHPLEYAKILIQIGYEPLPAASGRSLLGRVTLFYPNIFKYISHIKEKEGFFGLYRGLTPRIIGYVISGIAYQKVTEWIQFEDENPADAKLPPPIPVGPGEEVQIAEGDVPNNDFKTFIRQMTRDIAGKIVSVIVSQPFIVIAARTCAQFVSEESNYRGVLPSIREITSTEGLSGLFAGITPRLVGELLTVVLSGTVAFSINQFVGTKEGRGYVSMTVSILVSSFTYPYHVVATSMAVNGSRIQAGQPPFTPIYGNWYECWRDLSKRNQLKRGANLFWRQFPGPKVVVGGTAYPLGPVVTSFKPPTKSEL